MLQEIAPILVPTISGIVAIIVAWITTTLPRKTNMESARITSQSDSIQMLAKQSEIHVREIVRLESTVQLQSAEIDMQAAEIRSHKALIADLTEQLANTETAHQRNGKEVR